MFPGKWEKCFPQNKAYSKRIVYYFSTYVMNTWKKNPRTPLQLTQFVDFLACNEENNLLPLQIAEGQKQDPLDMYLARSAIQHLTWLFPCSIMSILKIYSKFCSLRKKLQIYTWVTHLHLNKVLLKITVKNLTWIWCDINNFLSRKWH